MKIARATSVALFLCIFNPTGRGEAPVHDAIHTVLNVAQQVYGQVRQEAQHVEDITKYTTMIQKQLEQINQLTSIINENMEQLRRFGSPDTYINMLGLDDLLAEVSKLKAGVGKTVADFTEAANGVAALKYTGEGLYQDLSELPDKFGRQVQYDTESFKKFGVVQDMSEDYNKELAAVNQSFARLEDEVQNTAHQIDTAGSLVETQKLKAKLQAVQGTLDTNMQRATLAALKVMVQAEANRNDQARAQEVVRQRRMQEMSMENQELRELGGKLLGPPGGN
jgi:septal ring factor EnvC (AmiA/AmiB activator)